jgi:hypothetical protein
MVFIALATWIRWHNHPDRGQNKAANADLSQVLAFIERRQVQSVEISHVFDLID